MLTVLHLRVCIAPYCCQVAGALWATAWIGSYLTLWWCVLLAYIGAFTLPVCYQAIKGRLEAAAKTIRAHTIVSYASARSTDVRGVCAL